MAAIMSIFCLIKSNLMIQNLKQNLEMQFSEWDHNLMKNLNGKCFIIYTNSSIQNNVNSLMKMPLYICLKNLHSLK